MIAHHPDLQLSRVCLLVVILALCWVALQAAADPTEADQTETDQIQAQNGWKTNEEFGGWDLDLE